MTLATHGVGHSGSSREINYIRGQADTPWTSQTSDHEKSSVTQDTRYYEAVITRKKLGNRLSWCNARALEDAAQCPYFLDISNAIYSI